MEVLGRLGGNETGLSSITVIGSAFVDPHHPLRASRQNEQAQVASMSVTFQELWSIGDVTVVMDHSCDCKRLFCLWRKSSLKQG